MHVLIYFTLVFEVPLIKYGKLLLKTFAGSRPATQDNARPLYQHRQNLHLYIASSVCGVIKTEQFLICKSLSTSWSGNSRSEIQQDVLSKPRKSLKYWAEVGTFRSLGNCGRWGFRYVCELSDIRVHAPEHRLEFPVVSKPFNTFLEWQNKMRFMGRTVLSWCSKTDVFCVYQAQKFLRGIIEKRQFDKHCGISHLVEANIIVNSWRKNYRRRRGF